MPNCTKGNLVFEPFCLARQKTCVRGNCFAWKDEVRPLVEEYVMANFRDAQLTVDEYELALQVGLAAVNEARRILYMHGVEV